MMMSINQALQKYNTLLKHLNSLGTFEVCLNEYHSFPSLMKKEIFFLHKFLAETLLTVTMQEQTATLLDSDKRQND
jgi:hypothetical protein